MKDMVIELSGIEVIRRGRKILEIENLRIAPGELVGLVGPNGAGKSTLLQLLDLQLPYRAGNFKLFGCATADEDHLALRRRCALVFQENLLLSGTVFENVALALKFRGMKAEQIRLEVEAALEAFHCAHLAQRAAHRLSGGEAQRVCLARALVAKPELLLLDEPFAALDAATRSRLLRELKEVAVRRAMTVLLVSHNFKEVLAFAGRALVLFEGKIVQDDLPETVLRRPNCREAARLVEMDNILPCSVERQGDITLIRLENGLRFQMQGVAPNACNMVCIPGDAFKVVAAETDDVWRGTVIDCNAGIGVRHLTVEVAGVDFSLCLPLEKCFSTGEKISLRLDATQAQLI